MSNVLKTLAVILPHKRFSFFRFTHQGVTFLLLIVLCIITAALTDTFLNWYNLVQNLLTNAVPLGIIACGMTLVMIGGGFDLSVGSITAVSAVVSVLVLQRMAGASPILAGWSALGVCLSAGLLLGLVNGIFIAYLRINPFVVTLSNMFIFRSFAYVLTHGGQSIQIPTELFKHFRVINWGSMDPVRYFTNSSSYPVPYPIFIFLGVFLIVFYLLRFTRFGYYIYALGGNENASWLAGINTRFVKMATYALCGLSCALAGFIFCAQSRTAEAASYYGFEMEAIAAVIVGGTPLGGGTGGLFGTLNGVLLLRVIDNLLPQFGVSSEYRLMVNGAIVLIVVAIDTLVRHRGQS